MLPHISIVSLHMLIIPAQRFYILHSFQLRSLLHLMKSYLFFEIYFSSSVNPPWHPSCPPLTYSPPRALGPSDRQCLLARETPMPNPYYYISQGTGRKWMVHADWVILKRDCLQKSGSKESLMNMAVHAWGGNGGGWQQEGISEPERIRRAGYYQPRRGQPDRNFKMQPACCSHTRLKSRE